VDLGPFRGGEVPPIFAEGTMVTRVLHCPYCDGVDIVRYGTSPQGKQRYRCREKPCKGRTFLLDYSYPGQSQHGKDRIVEMALNGSGIRDPARVLRVSMRTVLNELKKRNLTCTR
jgi:transposase-like protein